LWSPDQATRVSAKTVSRRQATSNNLTGSAFAGSAPLGGGL